MSQRGWVPAAWLAALAACSQPAEVVEVRHHGPVSLRGYRCWSDTDSSLVWRVCFSASEQRLIVDLKGVNYLYCGVPVSVHNGWADADSAGRYFNEFIKDHFNC